MKEAEKQPSKSILLGSSYVPYSVRFSTRARRWRISVTAEKVEIILPEGSRLRPERLIKEYADWILEKQAKLQKRKAKIEKKALPKGQILFNGKPVLVEVKPAGLLERPQVIPCQGSIRIVKGKGSSTKQLHSWLVNEAEAALTRQVQVRSSQMGVKPASMAVRNQRARWGSCSTRGTLSFNWRLIMAPPDVLDYVVVHELAHMTEHNHSKAFWSLVEKYCPDFQAHRNWLKQNHAAMWPDLFDK
jgi:predicted metal-dependent hydrolase